MPDFLEFSSTRNTCANQHPLMQQINSTLSSANFKDAAIQLYKTELHSQTDTPLDFTFGQGQTKVKTPSISYPILYQRTKIGDLHLHQSQQSEEYDENYLPGITKKLALLIKRHQANTLSSRFLGKDLSLTGYSDHVLKLDAFIEKASSTSYPVVINGEFGSEKLSVASAIHYNSQLRYKPFIEINCSTPSTEEFQRNLIISFEKAQGGSIFLHGIDELSFPQQNLLTELLAASTDPGLSGIKIKNVTNVRLMVSATRNLEEMINKDQFSRHLYEKFNFLTIRIPSLNERKEDIPYILEKLLEKYKLFDEQGFCDEVKKILSEYHWPGNHAELERVVARLMTLSSANPINRTELEKHAPELLATLAPQALTAKSSADTLPFDLIPCLLNKDFDKFSRLHTGLQKALTYLAENYCNSISLPQLAQNAYISPSHLSYLFKFYLKQSFKQIVSELRIERAKQIFISSPHARITDVSLDVGFGDLSHFEKIFKRYTQMTPREFKNSNT